MEELRIAMIGSVDAGKSSTTSVLINKMLDDGRGSARVKIMHNKHEKDTGRTSTVTENYYKITENKYITFVDLAGHEKYLKTTIYGLSSAHIDYGVIFVGANMGVSRMTQEHLMLCVTLRIPYMFVITKIDMSPKNILDETIESIKQLIKKVPNVEPLIVDDNVEINDIDVKQICPIFSVSNKTGDGVDKLRVFLSELKSIHNWDERKDKEMCFTINHKYNIKGIGMVFSGKVIAGEIHKGEKVLLGPFGGKWITVVARNLHNNFKTDVEILTAGESGCIAVKGKLDEHIKTKLRKGLVLINKVNKNAFRYFDAEIAILSKHSTTIQPRYSPIIHCNNIVQAAKIVDIYNNEKYIRCGDKAKVKFKFLYRPEFVDYGERFVFRDGHTKGFGKIVKIYEDGLHDNEKNDKQIRLEKRAGIKVV